MTNIKNIISKAWKFYFEEWKGHENICPAFGEKVLVTRLGWEHIVHHPRHKVADVARRLKSLEYAKKMLEIMPIYQEERKGKKYTYYGFKGVMDGKQIKVVVSCPKSNNKKYFFSVMVAGKKKKGSVSPL